MIGQTSLSDPHRFIARPSSVGTAATGISRASPKPLTVAAPILSPVKEPGPAAMAITSRSSGVISDAFMISSIIGIRVSE